MTGSPLRRITMETGQGFGVSWANVLAWSGSALYLGHCDYSDSDEQTGGFDIDEPLDLLAWLITDRFGQSNDALGEYAARVGIDVADWQRRPRSVETDQGTVVERMEGAESIIVVFRAGHGEKAAVIGDWQALTLLLLADRCQGVGAWGRVRALLEQAGATTTTIDHGYV